MRANFMPPDKQFEENVQDPHMVAQCRSNPDVLWVQHHNGIFKSTDGAASWTELTGITPSSFGFAVAVHPNDPDTAWFVPGTSDEKRCPIDGKVVVNRTRDGGKTFETITRGLPQEHAYDLVFRHALDVDDHGPDADVRIDDRIGVGERRRGRFVDRAVVESAAGLCGRVRKSR